MKLLPIIHYLLATAGSRPRVQTTWFVDGNNLMGHKGTAKDVDTLTQKLKPIRNVNAVILVLDGKPGISETVIEEDGIFRKVQLQDGISADDYLIEEIKSIRDTSPRSRIEVVTADRKLRKHILNIKPVVKGVANPVTFWRRYLPRLCGYKLPKSVDNDYDNDDENTATTS